FNRPGEDAGAMTAGPVADNREAELARIVIQLEVRPGILLLDVDVQIAGTVRGRSGRLTQRQGCRRDENRQGSAKTQKTFHRLSPAWGMTGDNLKRKAAIRNAKSETTSRFARLLPRLEMLLQEAKHGLVRRFLERPGVIMAAALDLLQRHLAALLQQPVAQ